MKGAGAYEKAPTEVGALQSLVARTRFELVISALRGRRPKPLDERAIMAGMEGVEPPLTEPESAVLPLDDIPVASRGNPRATKYITSACSHAQEDFCICLKYGPLACVRIAGQRLMPCRIGCYCGGSHTLQAVYPLLFALDREMEWHDCLRYRHPYLWYLEPVSVI